MVWNFIFKLNFSISQLFLKKTFFIILCGWVISLLRKQKLSECWDSFHFQSCIIWTWKAKFFELIYIGVIHKMTSRDFWCFLTLPLPSWHIGLDTSDTLRPWRHIWITPSFFFMDLISLWDIKFVILCPSYFGAV